MADGPAKQRTKPGWTLAALSLLWPWAIFCLLGALRFTRTMTRLELIALDSRFEARGPRPPRVPEVVIVEIDEATVGDTAFGPWPFERSRHAKLVEQLQDDGAAAIVFDVFFLTPSHDPDADRQFVEAVRRAGSVYLAARVSDQRLPATPEQLERCTLGPAPPGGPRPRAGFETPWPDLLEVAKGAGVVDVWSDPDNALRRVPLVQVHAGRLVPSLSLLVAADHLGVRYDEVQIDWGHTLRLGERSYPLNRVGTTALDFLGPGLHARRGSGTASPFRHYSYRDVCAGKLPKDTFQGKLVLIGWTASAVGGHDHFATPFDPQMPGVEVHATALENLLGRGPIRPVPTWANLLVLLGFTVGAGLVIPRLRALEAVALIVSLGGWFYFLNQWLFNRSELFLDLVTPLAGLGLVYLGQLALRMTGAEQRQDVMRKAFEFYVSPEVMQRLAKSGEDLLSLNAAERREVTVMFADVVGFTTMSEHLEPEDVTKVINEYFTDLTGILLRYEAYVDKYMGDCIMAVFNAFPQAAYPDHALRAARAALEMVEATRRLTAAAERRGERSFGIGIGINTGQVVAGNMGSRQRAQYSVIGDAVNLASRIEHLCREHDADVLIGEQTYQQCSYYVVTGQEASVTVRGRSEPTRIYELRGLKNTAELREF